MEKNKRKEIEARLREMMLSADKPETQNSFSSINSAGAMVIRRRKSVSRPIQGRGKERNHDNH